MTKSSRLTLLFTPLTLFLSVFPILINNRGSAFFAIDPDAMYMGNALSFIKSHQVTYLDHPGTPAILLIALSLFPLQILSKFIYHQNSITWIYSHLDFVYIYVRLVQATVSTLAVFLLLRLVYKYTYSKISVFFYWLLLMSYSSYFNSSTDISSESFNLLLVSIFSAFLLRYIYQPSPINIKLLAISAGLAVANRLTTIIYPILVFVISPVSSFFTLFIFLLGTYPIRLGYPTIFNWIIRLFTRSGLHGGGQTTIFDPHTYTSSLISLFYSDWIFIVLVLFGLFFLNKRLTWIYLTIIAAYLGFAKFPLTHYQLPNLVPLSLIATIIITKRYQHILIIPTIYILLSILPTVVGRYWQTVRVESDQVTSLQEFLDKNPAKYARIWEWGKSKEFFALWGNSWSGYFTGSELKEVLPNRLELLVPDLVRYPTAEKMSINELCFDQAILQQQSVVYVKISRPHTIEYIPNTKMAMIKTICSTKL